MAGKVRGIWPGGEGGGARGGEICRESSRHAWPDGKCKYLLVIGQHCKRMRLLEEQMSLSCKSFSNSCSFLVVWAKPAFLTYYLFLSFFAYLFI